MAPGKPGTIRREPVWYPSRIPPPATQQTVGWLAYVPDMGIGMGYGSPGCPDNIRQDLTLRGREPPLV